MEINFGSSVTNCSVIFDSSENANYGFGNNKFRITGNSWNGRVEFPYGANKISCSYSLEFNNAVKIPNSVTNLIGAFNYCNMFNQNVLIPNSVTNLIGTFCMCQELNQNIKIPNSIISMENTFANCRNLNQNIQIPNSVTSMNYTFSGCSNLNQNIQIPNSVTSMNRTFYNCSNLNQNIQIPNSVGIITLLFWGCNNLANITFSPTQRSADKMVGMIRSNGTKSINIWTDSTTATDIMNANFIEGNVQPTMEAIDNGYYNSEYNVYIYTNTVFN